MSMNQNQRSNFRNLPPAVQIAISNCPYRCEPVWVESIADVSQITQQPVKFFSSCKHCRAYWHNDAVGVLLLLYSGLSQEMCIVCKGPKTVAGKPSEEGGFPELVEHTCSGLNAALSMPEDNQTETGQPEGQQVDGSN